MPTFTRGLRDGEVTNAKVSASAGIARSKLASGTASHVVINDGSGVLSSEATLAESRGGTGASTIDAGIRTAISGTGSQVLRRNAGNTALEFATATSSNFIKMDTQQASTALSTTEIEILTKTWTANDFAANDLMIIFLQIIGTSGVATVPRIRVADGTNTFDAATMGHAGATPAAGANYIVFIAQGQDANTSLRISYFQLHDYTTLTSSALNAQQNTMIASWFASAFTISLRASVGAGTPTHYFKWWIYKLQA